MKEIKVQTFTSLIQYRRNDSKQRHIVQRLEKIISMYNVIRVVYVMGELERQMNVGSSFPFYLYDGNLM